VVIAGKSLQWSRVLSDIPHGPVNILFILDILSGLHFIVSREIAVSPVGMLNPETVDIAWEFH